MPRIAYLPGLLVLVLEGLIWGLSAATGWAGLIVIGGGTLMAGALGAILAFPITIESGSEHRWAWAVTSLCISALGLFFGFIFLLEAMTVGCNGSCFGD